MIFKIHLKFRILKCDTYTNYIMAMNVFLLAPILGCVSEVIRGELSEAVRAHESENCQVVRSLVSLAEERQE